MRIVELVNNLELGGVERLLVDLALSLRERGHHLFVVCLRRGGPLQHALEQAGIQILMLDKSEGPSLGVLPRLRRYLEQNEIDVIHSHNPLVHHYAVAAGRLAGVPVIVNTIHGPGNLSGKTGFKELLYGAACRLSDRIVAVCPSAHRTFSRGAVIPRSRLMTINNGIPLERFLEVPRRVPDERFVFGIAGRLAAVKDHRTLLEAFSIVVRRRPACRLEILGDGPLREELEASSSSLGLSGNVVFHGYSADVPAFLARIDASVLCSLSEGLPLSVLESMAAAVPVVGTDVGETKDLVQTARCGWLAPSADARRLAQAMLSAAGTSVDERHAMGARARRYAVENYSLQRMVEEYENLFLGLLGARRFGRCRPQPGL